MFEGIFETFLVENLSAPMRGEEYGPQSETFKQIISWLGRRFQVGKMGQVSGGGNMGGSFDDEEATCYLQHSSEDFVG